MLFDFLFNKHLSVFPESVIKRREIGVFIRLDFFNLLTSERARILCKNGFVLFAKGGKFLFVRLFKVQPFPADKLDRKSVV